MYCALKMVGYIAARQHAQMGGYFRVWRGRSAVEDAVLATLTERTKDRITFETTSEERTPGLLLLIHGSVFVGLPLCALTQYGVATVPAYILIGLIFLVGLAVAACGLNLLLRSEWLAIDLKRRAYFGRRGFLLWARRWAGPLEDFEHIRLCDIPCGRRGHHRRWVIEWEWSEKGRQPFRVSGWGWLKSFRIVSDRQVIGGLESLRELRGIAQDVDIPLILSKRYLEGLGVGDVELDISTESGAAMDPGRGVLWWACRWRPGPLSFGVGRTWRFAWRWRIAPLSGALACRMTWLLLGCVASVPSLDWLAWACMIPALFVCAVASRVSPSLTDHYLLMTGGHGPPSATGMALILVYFVPAIVGLFWQVVRFYRLHQKRPHPRWVDGDGARPGAGADLGRCHSCYHVGGRVLSLMDGKSSRTFPIEVPPCPARRSTRTPNASPGGSGWRSARRRATCS